MSRWLRFALFVLAWTLAACRPEPEPSLPDGLNMTLRFSLPGQACLDQGFTGWMVEVRQGSAAGEIVSSAYIEPFPFPIEGDFVDMDGDGYIFSDFWVGLLPAGDYHVRAYGVTDPGPPPAIAAFMTPAEAMVTLVEGQTTEIVLVTSCDNEPGALDVIVVVDGGPTLLDFDIDQKWVAVCQPTTFTATLANPERLPLTALWEIRDEAGALVLSENQSFPAGAPDPIVTSFSAWVPTPGDYTGTLTVTTSGSTSVFQFPWHVRFPGIAVGACDDGEGPVVLLSCDPDDGLPLVDDPACLDAAFGSTNGELPTCDVLVAEECFDDPCPLDDPNDTDGDGVCDSDDACPGQDDRVDGDGDGQPDACDPCPEHNPDDADSDGQCGAGDYYPCGPLDSDGDGLGDWCDPCPQDDPDDSDHDEVCDSDDVCPGEPDVDADHDGTIDCVEQACETNCTFTQGYWQNHPEAWPVQGLVIGGRTYSNAELEQILATPPKGDATYILAHQLIAARLNEAFGADTTEIATTLAEADAWLATRRLGSNPQGPMRQKGIDLAAVLDEFNNGVLGPGHCTDCAN